MNEQKTGGRVIRVLAFGLAAAFCAATAWAGPVAGVVVSMEGKPQLKSGAQEYKRLKLNQIVHDGDFVKTEAGDKVGIAFVGGAEMRINENSVFEIQSGGGTKETSVKTVLGNVWTRLIGKHAAVNIRTGLAVAAVRGTEADVEVGDTMAVKVYDGHVDLMNEKGTTALHAGQQASVDGAGAAPGAAQTLPPSEYGTWQNGLQPANLKKSLELLNKAAVKNRTLELEMKDKQGQPKKVKMNFEKK